MRFPSNALCTWAVPLVTYLIEFVVSQVEHLELLEVGEGVGEAL